MELHFCTFPLLSFLLCAKKARLSMKFIDILCRNITFITKKYILFSGFVYPRFFSLILPPFFSFKKLTYKRGTVYNMGVEKAGRYACRFCLRRIPTFKYHIYLWRYHHYGKQKHGHCASRTGHCFGRFAFIVPIVGLICGIIGTVLGVKANKVAPSGMSKGGLGPLNHRYRSFRDFVDRSRSLCNCACRYSSFPCWYDVIDLHQNRQASFPVCLFFIA